MSASSVMDNSTTMAHWVMTATATEADVMRAAWVRKLEDRLIVSDNKGATVLFRSPLSLNNLQRKVSELKKTQGCEHAQVKQLDEAGWLQQRAAVESKPRRARRWGAAPPVSTLRARRRAVAPVTALRTAWRVEAPCRM